MKYDLYATTKDGNGYGQFIGSFKDPSDIKIHIGMFSPDVLIEIVEVDEEDDRVSKLAKLMYREDYGDPAVPSVV